MSQIRTQKVQPIAAYPDNWDGFNIRRISPWAIAREKTADMLRRARQLRATNQMRVVRIARFQYFIIGMNTIVLNTRPGAIA